MHFRKWVVALLLFSAAVIAADYSVSVSATGTPNGPNAGSDDQRSQATAVAWTSANPNTTPSVGDTITGNFSDGWSQRFEITIITNGLIQTMRAVPGTLVYNGASNTAEIDYSDQAGQCGGHYEEHYRYWEVTTYGETSSGWTLIGITYVPNC
jgi:hypothetical protein